ncbi:MAG: CopD family protein [Devosia sp.]
MDFAYIIALLLFFIHIGAFVAGGANAVLMPVMGPKFATATPEMRTQLWDIAEKVSKIGKVALGTLLVTGVLTLWLKYNWAPPNAIWFWIKMAAVVAMIVLIAINERLAHSAKQGDMEAARRSKTFGQLTAAAFAVVIFSAVFAFNT